ncbi:chemotaxis protein CheY [Mycolicibacterium stellerae]|uniref:chemotaxis protein CheY n=1 Tax=Mycolicibacterium stellerae TaxID=2358193 RepID=UPI000F0B3405|nr:chemotaxis protein CheY [Mycolicibacterium stellerae]
MEILIDHLAEARKAHRRNDWRASYAAFVRADGLGPMPTDDLDAYSAAAWRLGHASEAVRLAERTYDRLVRTDPAAATMTAAVLSMQWRARQHQAVARQWADRARGLLAGVSTSGTHGYLAYLDAATALDEDDADTLTRAATALRQTVANTADATLAVLSRVVDGITALRQSRVDDGYRLLDDALLPALDDGVQLEWAGDVYRLVLRSGDRVDADHRQAWTESMRRWVVVTGVVIDTGAAAGS